MPLFRSTSAAESSSSVEPKGVMALMPVTTTRGAEELMVRWRGGETSAAMEGGQRLVGNVRFYVARAETSITACWS